MYQTGEIIYFDELYFNNLIKDPKKNRPCIVLFSKLTKDKKEVIYFCKLTTSLHRFNHYSKFYHVLTQPVYNQKISFAMISQIYTSYNSSGVHATGIVLRQDAFDIIHKICNHYNKEKKAHDDTKEILCYMDRFVRKEELKSSMDIKQKVKRLR